MVVLAPAIGLVVAAVAVMADFPSWAVGVHGDYYFVVASVIPVLVLAFMVELGTVVRVTSLAHVLRGLVYAVAALEDFDAGHRLGAVRHGLKRIEDEYRDRAVAVLGRLRWGVRGFFLAALAGEVVSLYAIGADTSTPFTLVLSAIEVLGLALIFVMTFELRFKFE